MACALWDVSLAQGREILEDLAGHYSFIFAGYGPYEIHDLVHEFVRADTLAEGRNSFDWPALRVGLGRALSILEERIGQIKRDIVDTDKRYAHSAWREAILDRLNVLLWMGDEDAAKRVLLNRWIEARYAIPGFATSLTDLVAELAPKTPYWERLVQAVRAPEYGATLLPTGKMRIQFDQHDYSQLDDYVAFLETRSQAMLLYLRAQQVRVAFIRSARELQRLEMSLSLLKKGLALDPTWAELRATLAEVYAVRAAYHLWQEKDYMGAIADYDRAVALQPNDIDLLTSRGVARRKCGDLRDALEDFNEALALQPDDPAIFHNLGIAKRMLDDFDGAIADYDRSLSLRPNDPGTLNGRGITKRKQGDFEGALADFNRAIALRPNNAYALNSRGYLYARLREFEKAIIDLQAAIKIDPQFSMAYCSLAETYIFMGSYDTALEWLAKAIKLDPDRRRYATVQPDYNPIRADPRFIALVGEEPRTENGGTAEAAE